MFPNYDKSILNLITSILNNYGVENGHTSLAKIDEKLKEDYQNIVLIILDGMGENVLSKLSPQGYFSKNKADVITSIFPPTTAAALSVYYSGKAPIENGWIAWSQYFKEFGRAIDMLPCCDSYTGEPIKHKEKPVYSYVDYKSVYHQIEEKQKNVKTYEIKPSYCESRAEVTVNADTIDKMCKAIETLCKADEKKYIFAYNDNPDKTLHRKGCYSDEAKVFIEETQEKIKDMCEKLEGTNTLVIITADHGHTPIEKIYSIQDFPELQEYFEMPPSFESRFLTFWIKKGKEEEFRTKFEERFGEEFKMYSKKEFLDLHLLGYGNMHKKIDDFIGDFVAIATSSTMIKPETNLSREKYVKVSNHCGMTQDEMEVPLIVIELK